MIVTGKTSEGDSICEPQGKTTFINERCPRCGSTLLSDGKHVWCSFIGGRAEDACSYGIDKPIERTKEKKCDS